MLVVLTLWQLPKWQVARSQGLSAKNRFDRENEARKTLAQIIGGVFLLAGLYSSVKTFDLQRETEKLQQKTEETQEQGQITDRYTKAIDQLGAVLPRTAADKDPKPNLEVRIGGIYALERIAHDSPKDQPTIMEVLSAYVRDNLPPVPNKPAKPASPQTEQKELRPDIKAALVVIGRRNSTYDPPNRLPDLENVNLANIYLRGMQLEKIDLNGADLRVADLSAADLSGADLRVADLSAADLTGAHLSRAHLSGADLKGAWLYEADLTGADLGLANLSGADLSGAHLTGADFGGADLTGAKGLTQEQLNRACGDENTVPPKGKNKPPLCKTK